MGGKEEVGQESSYSRPLMQLSPEYDQPVTEVVFKTRLGRKDGYHRSVTEEGLLDNVSSRVGLVVKDGKIIPVIVGLDQPLFLENHLGRGIRGSVPTRDEQRAIKGISELTGAHLEINFKATVAEKVLALEAMAGQLPGPLKEFKLDAKTRNRLQGDVRRAGLIPVNQALTDLAAMELEPVPGRGENYQDTPVDAILDRVTSRLAKWLPTQARMTGLAAPETASIDGQPTTLVLEAKGSKRGGGGMFQPTGDAKFDRQIRNFKKTLFVSSGLVVGGIIIAFCGPRIINAIDGMPLDVEPTQVYLPTPTSTEQPSPTPDLGLVGVATSTPEVTPMIIGTSTPGEIGGPTVWQPPTLEQAQAGRGGPLPEDYAQVAETMTTIVLRDIPKAVTAGAVWNSGYGENFHTVFWAKAANGNFIWKQGGSLMAFDEYPMHWNEWQSGFIAGQSFSEIPDSKDAVLGFTGPSAAGLGEKPVLMKTAVDLANGRQEFLEYFDFTSGEWQMNPAVLQALAPDGYTVSQDEGGNWIASGDNQALLQFDLVKNMWREALSPEAVFVPEGFRIGELGLLWDQNIGKDVLAFNPEANWEKVREEIIRGLWQANKDWFSFTGEGSDALNYSEEAFIKAALEGKVFKIGIPVRADIDWDNVDMEKWAGTSAYNVRPSLLELKMVEAKLDDIKIQILDPDAFKNYLEGKGWLNSDMEAFSPYVGPLNQSSTDAIYFSVGNGGELIISIGSYYFGNTRPVSEEFWLGRFNSEKGIGSQADRAVTLFLGNAIFKLENFSAGELKFTGLDGTIIKYISLSRIAQDVVWDKWCLSPQLFIFNK